MVAMVAMHLIAQQLHQALQVQMEIHLRVLEVEAEELVVQHIQEPLHQPELAEMVSATIRVSHIIPSA
jgi:nickel-dependent lactate racemase